MSHHEHAGPNGRDLRVLRSCAWLGAALLALGSAQAQTIVNADFENGTTGWSGCVTEISTATTYGGTGTGHVAEVDGNFDPAAYDDRILCQTISGFTVGGHYIFAFDATRRGTGTPPSPVVVNVTIDGSALSTTVSRTGGYSMQRQQIDFTATQITHTLTITPTFTNSYGMLFDNLSFTAGSSLPIELLTFTAHAGQGAVELEWTTASEQGNAYFLAERSTNGHDWIAVATVPGAGHSAVPLDYTARDEQPQNGLAYYRLRQVDTDGSESASEMQPVWFQNDAPVVMWPDPATDNLNIVGPVVVTGVQLMDDMGRICQVRASGTADRITLDIAQLPIGNYVVRSTADGRALGHFVKH
ncbi:MAG TPA: hypothetical protein PK760_07500 [Flavobacteriales bacterium]|nr:hypothetical protein [Flavobacteriales bacterium]